MADTVASPLLQLLSDRLYTLARLPNKGILGNLRLTLAQVQTLVQDAEARSAGNEALKCWITEVKSTAYEADDLFDEYTLWTTRRRPRSVISFAFFNNHFIFGFSLGRKLKKIERRLDSLLKRCVEFGRVSDVMTVEESSSAHGVERHSSSYMFDSGILGRDLDKENVLSLLFKSSEENQLSIIPIVGMGGVGKTTLTQLIYNDERVSHYFQLKLWVCVSEDFDLIKIAKAIIEQMDQESKDLSILEVLHETIWQMVARKRFLIVLDDVWNEDQRKWSMMLRGFRGGAAGSAVIITTRNVRVASSIGTVPPYSLQPLAEDDSWSLFKQVAFNSILDEENPELVEIAHKIVRKCGGLPLAIKSLAGLMRSKRKVSEWLFVMEEDTWNLPEFESHILPVLRLSYNHLPSPLKQCFAYCSIFPKNHTINKEKLIQLWIAEGFIRSGKGSRRLEDAANEYFMELLERSFFVDVTKDEFGEITDCKMHDLVHDLAQSVASVGCSIVETGDSQDLSKELRYSSLVGKSETSIIPEALNEATNLRTLLLLSCKFEYIPKFLLKFGCLRVLDLSQSGIRKLSGTIGNLKHLRYLNLSHTYIKTLPESISNLRNLLTLELVECYDLLELPKAISELINLRNLDIQSCPLLSHMPSGIGKLKFLQKLPTFVLNDIDGCARLGDLQGLELRDRLEIKNLEYVKFSTDALEVKLHEKAGINSLALSWGQDFNMVNKVSAEVLEELRPSSHLKVLEIIGYRWFKFPSWLRNQDLPNLVKISLANCTCRELPPLGELPYLKYLSIKGLSEVRSIGVEFYGESNFNSFPSLKQLELFDMPNLFDWKIFRLDESISFSSNQESTSNSYQEVFPCLETLTVMGCSKLTSLPPLPHLKSLALWHCNKELLCLVSHLKSLSSLLVYEFRVLQELDLCLEEVGFSSVTTLTMYNCDDLMSWLDEAIKGFTSLNHLSILYCEKLVSLPPAVGYLTTLQKLNIAECQDLRSMPNTMSKLSSLKEMTIEACPLLESLPQGLLDLPNLKFEIRECPKLEKFLDTKGDCDMP